jgi:AcrR family transcriptional regulator
MAERMRALETRRPSPVNRSAGSRRTGRRPGDSSDTRQQILDAARTAFGERGYSATSMRSIAAAAGVDVALVAYYFGRKEQMFAAVMELPVNPGEVIERAFADGLEGVGTRLVDLFLGVWEDPASGPAMQALFRGAAAREESRRALSEFAAKEVIGRYAGHLTAEEPERRASLAATQLLGVAIMRYVIRVEPVVTLRREDLVADLGRTIQGYLTGPLASAD